MNILSRVGNEGIATVYIADMGEGRLVEFVESVQPPIPREKKWVLIISTLFGCPVGCLMCDAGNDYKGKLSEDQMFSQIDFLVCKRFPDKSIPVEKFKIQFARVGEPAFNDHVVDVLKNLPQRYNAPGIMPTISTIAPEGTDRFFDALLAIKKAIYTQGHFLLQFSLHSTDEKTRDWLIPVRKWNLAKIAEYGEKFFESGDRKITLNFALGSNICIEPGVLSSFFDPDKFLIKITPINPTYRMAQNKLISYINPYGNEKDYDKFLEDLRLWGYEVILSIGEVEENKIGSNCGQFVTRYLGTNEYIDDAYTYTVEPYK